MRTLDEITTSIRANFIANSDLQGIYGFSGTDTWSDVFSKVSIEALFTYIVAVAIWVHEAVIDTSKNEINTALSEQKLMSIPWFYSLAMKFQYGDGLIYNESTYSWEYTTIDTAKQIIKYVAIRETVVAGVSTLRFFVSKADKVKLTSAELAAFKNYLKLAGAAGMHYDIVSDDPYPITLTAKFYYNPQLLSATGALLADGSKPIVVAISNYFNTIKYGGVFSRQKLVDAMQAATGVSDLELLEVKFNGVVSTVPFFESPSGAFSFTESSLTATYIAYEY